MWFNSLIASARAAQIVDQNGDVKVDDSTAREGAEIMSKLADVRRADPAMSHHRGGPGAARRSSRAARPSRSTTRSSIRARRPNAPGSSSEDRLGARTRGSTPSRPSAPPLGGINLGVGAYTKHPDLAFDAATCLATAGEPARGAPRRAACRRRTRIGLRHDPELKKAVSRSPTCSAAVDRAAAPRPSDAGLQRHLAGDPEGVPPAGLASTRRPIAYEQAAATASRRRPRGGSADGGGDRPPPSPRRRARQRASASKA